MISCLYLIGGETQSPVCLDVGAHGRLVGECGGRVGHCLTFSSCLQQLLIAAVLQRGISEDGLQRPSVMHWY